MKIKLLFLLLALIILSALGLLGYGFLKEKNPTSPVVNFISQKMKIAVTPTPTSFLETKTTPSLKATPTVPLKSDSDMIVEAMAKKHQKPVAEVNLAVSQNNGTYAKGSVSFKNEVGGGWWLGYQEKGGWLIVADGNGTVSCQEIEPYDFPQSMVTECYDEVTKKLIKR